MTDRAFEFTKMTYQKKKNPLNYNMTDRDFKLLVRAMRDKQKRITLNRDFFPSKQFNEMEASERLVDKELEAFTEREQQELPFKEKEI